MPMLSLITQHAGIIWKKLKLSFTILLHLCLQQVINRIKEWCDKWLLKRNISKCKTVLYCVKNMIDTEYFINDGGIDDRSRDRKTR